MGKGIVILASMLLVAIILVSGCTVPPLATGKMHEPNLIMCKADCWNWCRLCDKPPNNICAKDYEVEFNEETLECVCKCFAEER